MGRGWSRPDGSEALCVQKSLETATVVGERRDCQYLDAASPAWSLGRNRVMGLCFH